MRNHIFFLCLLALILFACRQNLPTPTPESTAENPGQPPTLPPTDLPPPTPVPTEQPPPTETVSASSAGEERPVDPKPSVAGDIVFHQGLGMVVMFNGSEDNRLWGWDGTAWQIVDEGGPNGRTNSGLAYDPQRDKLVLYGGLSIPTTECTADTWEWDGGGWQQLDVPGPDACSHFVMEYDSTLGKVLLFGGADEQLAASTDMWSWDGRVWEQLDAQTPPARFHAMSAADGEQGDHYLIGGFDINNQMVDEMWRWDGMTWEQLDFSRPPALSHARMVFDSGRGQLFLFGGTTRARTPFDLHNESWILSGGSWQQVNIDEPAPSPRAEYAMAYDPVRGRIVLFGGLGAEQVDLTDTWEWNGSAWICLDQCRPDPEIISQVSFGPEVVVYYGDVRRTGVYDFPAIGTLPEQGWQTDTDEDYLEYPLLYDGVVYTGSSSGKLFAFDASSGDELWQGGDFDNGVSAVAIAGDVRPL